ncbi:signal transduction histidine kinase [Flavobacterium granuli]|uniref:histidine kinase n=2 Tax=Flavobacterium granuli TaxID=280093 RepID=A0A1M5J9P8_9FLAO|nr:ATP-binding protein [Flavobacterium granuli]PRZ28292.1 signal transduction histidine kinase [Flavobacterium granuli]SHG37287.1 Signal transduction histidine kinase [Flavobacterium granuli]
MKYLFIFIFFTSLLHSQKMEKTDSLSYYDNLSNYNIKINKYKDALSFIQKAINYSEINNKTKEQADRTFNLGSIYFELAKYNDAIESFSESITLYESLPPSSRYAQTYYYLGVCHIKKENYTSAEICLNKAQSIFKELNISDFNESIKLQKGIIYKSAGKYDLASRMFSTIISNQEIVSQLDLKAEALYQIGLIEKIKNRNNLALNYLNKAYELNAKTKNLEQKSNILLALSDIHERLLDRSSAYSYLKSHLNLKENISIANNEKLGIDDYEKFKETQQAKKIEQIKKQKKEKEKENKFAKLINILSIALISILSLLSLSLYKNNIIRNKSNLLLTEKNNELIVAKEKAEKASQARSEFLSTVSHELRTPLNAINGITHLLLEEKPKKSQLHYLSSLQFSGNYLTTFINDILEINKIESDKAEIENINFNLKKLLKDIKKSLKEVALKNENQFHLIIDDAIPDILIGDPTKLSQIVMNLINNALKFTKNGKVTITAKLLSTENNTAAIRFQIIDTGIGIPQDKLESVFESFSQGSIEINRKYGGTGLGLTIVNKLINLLGGQIKLESIEGKGASFSFDLDFKVNELQLPEEKKTKTYDESVFKNIKVLAVEDNQINQMITKKMLENKGMLCEIIGSGEEAIEIVKNNKFDLILMDVHLPGINGTVATKKIREFDTTTPIIAITAISLNENREMLLSFGMNDVITKPFAPADFYDTIAQNI